jgi:hypothetical protein
VYEQTTYDNCGVVLFDLSKIMRALQSPTDYEEKYKDKSVEGFQHQGYGAKLKEVLLQDLASRGECGYVIYLEGDSYYTEYDDVVQAFLQYLDVDAGIEFALFMREEYVESRAREQKSRGLWKGDIKDWSVVEKIIAGDGELVDEVNAGEMVSPDCAAAPAVEEDS